MQPQFFIVGAPKCGTTSMAQYLNQHPDVFVLRGEPHFFGTDIDYNHPRLSRRQYLSICRRNGGKSLVGDRSTWYLYSKRAAAEIHDFNPDARIIAMLRNPVEMIRSLHRHQFQRGRRDDIERLEDALDAEPDRRLGRRLPDNVRFPGSLLYSEIARYSEQLPRYFERFGRDRVHVILFDDLKADPTTTYAQALEFLGVDSGFVPDFRVHNAGAPMPDWAPYRIWKASTLRYRFRSIVPERLYSAIRERRRKQLADAKDRQPPPPMDVGLRDRLRTRLGAEIEQLEALIDRNLEAWR